MAESTRQFDDFMAAALARYAANLTFPELRRAVQAVSTIYVERRTRIGGRGAADSAGKRAAFAIYFGGLHFLTIREVVRALAANAPTPEVIVDLGCGTLVGGAAWALQAGGRPEVRGLDQEPWAVAEASWTLRQFGLSGRARRGDLNRFELPGARSAILLAYAVNELDDNARDSLLSTLCEAGERGAQVLVVEPVARSISPWWNKWCVRFEACGGRGDDWCFQLDLPEILTKLDKAAGLDHRVLKARSLYIPAGKSP